MPSRNSAIADRIARHARQLGWRAETSGSNLSSSAYVVATWSPAGDDDGLETVTLKIRVSDHDLPPSYGRADLEVGPHGGGHVDGWAGVVARLASITDQPVPAPVRRELNRLGRLRAARAAFDRQVDERRLAQVERSERVTAVMVERGINHLTGRERKDARSKIIRELGL